MIATTTMIDNVIKKFGFEHEHTIAMCKVIQEYELGHLTLASVQAQYKWSMEETR
jgi:hypothetical protein